MSTVYDEKLLDKVGLAMVPSGYTNNVADVDNLGGALGKVYSVLPIQTIGDNVVTNGDFSDGSTGWTVGSWVVQNEEATIDGSQSSVAPLTKYNIPIYSNDTLKLTFDVTRSAGTISYMYLAGTFISGGINESGTYTYTVNYTNSQTLQIVADADFVGSVDNIKVQRITDGDFDFSRGSDATRVNLQGYIESVQVLSNELVQNGDFEEIGSEEVTNGGFDDSSTWIIPSGGWSIGNGVASCDGSNSRLIYQNLSNTTTSDIFKVTYSVSNYVSGNVQVGFGSGLIEPIGTVRNSNGTYTEYIQKTSTSLSFGFKSTSFVGSIDNVSVKEVGQNWDFGTDVTVGDGFVKMDNSAALQGVLQAGVITNGSVCTVTFTVQNYISGIVNLRHPLNESVSANGTYTFTGNANDTKLLIRGNDTSNDFEVTNISVIEITDDTDIPRLDYTNAACPSLLLEPQRINYILQSEDLNSITIKTGGYSITNNEATSPEGKNNASELEIISTGQQYIGRSFTLAGNRVISAFVKYNNSATRFYLGSFTTTHDVANAVFDIENGTILSETTGSTNNKILEEAIIEDYGSGWYRCAVHISGTSGVTAYGISDTDTADLIPQLSTTGINLYAWGLQAEQGSYPTSYIPTNGLLVTRRADICNNAGDSTIFNDSEGVLFGEFIVDNVAAKTGLMSINDSSISNLLIATINTNKQIQIEGTGSVNVLDATVNTLGERIKIAFSYGQETAVFINGNKTSIEADVFSGTGLNQAWIGSNPYGHLEGIKCNSFFYFPEVLSDAELEYITSADIDLTIHNYKGSLSKISATYEDVGIKDRLTKLF